MTSDLLKLSDANVRIEMMFWLPGMLCADVYPEAWYDFCGDYYYGVVDLVQIFGDAVPGLARLVAEDELMDGELAELLLEAEASGFLVQFAHPVPTFSSASSSEWSWGRSCTRWFYGADLAELVDQAVQWAGEVDGEQRQLFLGEKVSP